MSKRIGLIVGVGSIGRRHAVVMAERYEQLFVVDSSLTAQKWAKEHLPSHAKVFGALPDALADIGKHAAQVTAVIASWGPHHFEAFSRLVQSGVRRVFCEKPLATSLQQIRTMNSISKEHSVQVTAGLHLRYRGMSEFIQRISVERLGGKPTTFVVDGGARCLATTGSHWIDFAIAVFGASPKSVIASLRSAPINPRSETLQYWDGVAVWEFPQGQRATITYDNASSVHERARFYASAGVVEIDTSLTVRVFQRDPNEVAADRRVIRVGEVRRDELVGEFIPDLGEVLSVQLDEIEGVRVSSYGLPEVVESANALLAAFESSRLGKRIEFPLSDDVIADSQDWAIS
jgi:predicted dehydrogenase